jgi:hypothetical protein
MRSIVVLAVVVALAGCSPQSAKAKWVASTDKRCDDLTKRFTGSLAWGDGIGADDLGKMDKRVALIRDLQAHAREHPPSEVNRHDLDDWLNKLGAADLDDAITAIKHARSQLCEPRRS